MNNQSNHKAEALAHLRAAHQPLEDTLVGLSAAQMTTPGVYADGNGEWTVKDILAHITWWEQSVFGWLGLPRAVERSPIPAGELNDDEVNQAIFVGNRDRPLDEVKRNFHHSYDALVRAIETASEEQLAQPRSSDPDGSPIYEILPGNTYEHYQIHLQSIRDWLNQQ